MNNNSGLILKGWLTSTNKIGYNNETGYFKLDKKGIYSVHLHVLFSCPHKFKNTKVTCKLVTKDRIQIKKKIDEKTIDCQHGGENTKATENCQIFWEDHFDRRTEVFIEVSRLDLVVRDAAYSSFSLRWVGL